MTFHPEGKTINRAELLSPEAIPGKIAGRFEQMEKLHNCLRPTDKAFAPMSAWLYGPPGAGKTATARIVTERVSNVHNHICLYVNCWERPTIYSIVQAICEQLEVLSADVRDTSVKLAKIRQVLKDKTTLIILDEIDRPTPKERDCIVYSLLQLPRTRLFCISTHTSPLVQLEERIRSRLTPTLVYFPAYSSAEIEAILTERAENAFFPNTCQERILGRIASLARGDARKAIHLLLRTAITAERNRAERLNVKHIPADTSSWYKWQRASRVESLPTHQQMIYRLLKEHGKISSDTLRRLYLVACQRKSIEPVARRTFSKYIALLAQSNFISVESKATGGPGILLTVTS